MSGFLYIGYFSTLLDPVIITEFSDWLWGHIFTIFLKKKERSRNLESLTTLLSRTTVTILWRHSQKCIRIKIWALEIFSVEFFHYFWPICHNQRIRGLMLAQKDLFSASSYTTSLSSYRSNPTWKNTIKFTN